MFPRALTDIFNLRRDSVDGIAMLEVENNAKVWEEALESYVMDACLISGGNDTQLEAV